VVSVIFEPSFKKEFKRIRQRFHKQRIIKQVSKIKFNPEIGKPMRHTRKGTRELYIAPFRLSYRIEGEKVYILALYHKDRQ